MIKKNNFPVLVLSAILIGLMPFSCIDRIELEPPTDLTDAIVIQGRAVLGENSRIEIKTTRLFDFSSESKLALNVKDAILRDDKGNMMELEPLFKGIFNTPLDENSPIQLEVGRSYSLEITTLDNRTYVSTFEQLPANSSPSQISFKPAEIQRPNATGNLEIIRQIESFIDTDVTEDANGLMWEVDRNYRLTDSPLDGPIKTCYLTSAISLENIPIFTEGEGATLSLNEFSLGVQIIDFKFAEGMYVIARQYSLSNGANNYWEAVSSLAKKEGDLFDDPVGLIPTNFKNINDESDQVFGYFFATQETLIRKRVPESLIGEVMLPCPPTNPPPAQGNLCNLGICCDCLEGSQATLIKPDYWID